MAAMLSFEQAPPISVPFRFFLTAPLFGVAAGLYLVWLGAEAFSVRASFGALALTHFVTVGMLLQVMCGALLQLSPVAVGANVWRPGWTGGLLHLGLTAGGVCLVAGFALSQAAFFQVAAVLLGVSLTAFVIVMLIALLRTPARGPTVEALRIAIAGLAVTVVLGVTLASVFGWGLPAPIDRLLPMHAGWGIIGWGLVLVAGVSYLVVPMFQLTPAYPAGYARWLPRALFAGMVLWSLARAAGDGWAIAQQIFGLVVLVGGASYGVVTLRLQRRRRRKVADATLQFFRIAMASGLAAALVALAAAFSSATLRDALEMAVGVLLLAGFFVSVVNGMLYKIVPFITWLHLQKRMPVPPNMSQIIPERLTRRQLQVHLAALAVLLVAVMVPGLAAVAGLVFALSCGFLGANLLRAVRRYRSVVSGNELAAGAGKA